MKNIFLAFVLSLCIIGSVYADVGMTSNASPAIVEVSNASPTHEVTFPQVIRNVSVFNYDPDDGVWVNFRGGDTRGVGGNSSRFYLGPSSVITLNDFQTEAITIVYDNGTFSAGTASPVSVIATY